MPIKQRATVVSIPHAGTHLAVYMLEAAGFDVRFTHLGPSPREKVIAMNVLEAAAESGHLVVIPHRRVYQVIKSWSDRGSPIEELIRCYKNYSEFHDERFYHAVPLKYHVSDGEEGTRGFAQKLITYTDYQGTEEEFLGMWKWVEKEDIPHLHSLALGDVIEARDWAGHKYYNPNASRIHEITMQIGELRRELQRLQS